MSGSVTVKKARIRLEPSTMRRLLEVARDAADEPAQRPDGERQDEAEVGEREPEIVLISVPAVEHLEQRDDERLGRDHLDEQDGDDEGRAPPEPEAGDGDGGEEGDEQGEHDGQRR